MTVYHAKTDPDLLSCLRQGLGSAAPLVQNHPALDS